MGNPIAIQLLTGATPTWDALYKFAKITAEANTAITISGAGTPDGGVLHFKQDATGSRTLSINGTAITVNTAAGSLTQIQWSYDGEDYLYHTNVQGGASGSMVQLSAPTLSATAVSSSAIDVVVGTVSDASSYEVYESPDNATWTLIGTTAGTYNRTGKSAYTQFYYRAKAIGNGTTYSDSAYATANATTEAESTTKAAAYISAVQAAGGTLDATAQTGLTNFETAIDAIGAAKFKQILLYAGGTAGSAVIDFMGNQNGTLVGSPTVDAFGVVLNGTSQYVNSGLVPSAHFTINDIGFSQKLKTNAANNHRSGVYVDATGDLIGLTLNGDGVNTYLLCGNLFTVVSIDNPLTGYHVPMTVLRRSSTDSECYISGASFVNNSTDAFSALPGIAMFYGAQNWDGTPMYFTGNTLEFNAMHTGLTDAEVNSLHTAINSLMTALGR